MSRKVERWERYSILLDTFVTCKDRFFSTFLGINYPISIKPLCTNCKKDDCEEMCFRARDPWWEEKREKRELEALEDYKTHSNPLTNKFRGLEYFNSVFMPKQLKTYREKEMYVELLNYNKRRKLAGKRILSERQLVFTLSKCLAFLFTNAFELLYY